MQLLRPDGFTVPMVCEMIYPYASSLATTGESRSGPLFGIDQQECYPVPGSFIRTMMTVLLCLLSKTEHTPEISTGNATETARGRRSPGPVPCAAFHTGNSLHADVM